MAVSNDDGLFKQLTENMKNNFDAYRMVFLRLKHLVLSRDPATIIPPLPQFKTPQQEEIEASQYNSESMPSKRRRHRAFEVALIAFVMLIEAIRTMNELFTLEVRKDVERMEALVKESFSDEPWADQIILDQQKNRMLAVINQTISEIDKILKRIQQALEALNSNLAIHVDNFVFAAHDIFKESLDAFFLANDDDPSKLKMVDIIKTYRREIEEININELRKAKNTNFTVEEAHKNTIDNIFMIISQKSGIGLEKVALNLSPLEEDLKRKGEGLNQFLAPIKTGQQNIALVKTQEKSILQMRKSFEEINTHINNLSSHKAAETMQAIANKNFSDCKDILSVTNNLLDEIMPQVTKQNSKAVSHSKDAPNIQSNSFQSSTKLVNVFFNENKLLQPTEVANPADNAKSVKAAK